MSVREKIEKGIEALECLDQTFRVSQGHGGEVMNLDRTFCSGLRCPRANSCERWTENLKKYAADSPETRRKFLEFWMRRLSVAQFGDFDGRCNWYEPIEQVSTPETLNPERT